MHCVRSISDVVKRIYVKSLFVVFTVCENTYRATSTAVIKDSAGGNII